MHLSHACFFVVAGILTLFMVFVVLVIVLLRVKNSGQDQRGVIAHLKRSRRDVTNLEIQSAARARATLGFV